jgi:CRISPR system Cascade subunit CasE
MTFLSQLFINKTDAARRRISDAYAWHQVIWKNFVNCDGKPRSFLFRIDDAGSRFRLLLLSETEPSSDDLGRWQVKTISPDFLDHQYYRFQIKANPTMRRASDRRRIGIYAENRLREWIEKKAEQNGFKIEPHSLTMGAPMDEIFVRNRTRGKHVSVDFQGALNVIDPQAFRIAFKKGIGSAKSFGYGMLMLQPANVSS